MIRRSSHLESLIYKQLGMHRSYRFVKQLYQVRSNNKYFLKIGAKLLEIFLSN